MLGPLLRPTPVRAEVRTLSAEIDRLGVCEGGARVALCKIDVEGAEWDVMRGVEDRHWRLIDNVIVETHHRGSRVDDVVALLRRHGFRSVVSRENGPPLFLPFTYLGLTEPVRVDTSFERLSTVFASRSV